MRGKKRTVQNTGVSNVTQNTSSDYVYTSYEEWERKNFPSLSPETDDHFQKCKDLGISKETLEKIKNIIF